MHPLSYSVLFGSLQSKCVVLSLPSDSWERYHWTTSCSFHSYMCLRFRTEQFQESQWRKMKTPEGETGATRLSLSSPVLVTQWGWETSGGSLTFATGMEEVTSFDLVFFGFFLYLCPVISILTFSQCLSCTVQLAFYNFCQISKID